MDFVAPGCRSRASCVGREGLRGRHLRHGHMEVGSRVCPLGDGLAGPFAVVIQMLDGPYNPFQLVTVWTGSLFFQFWKYSCYSRKTLTHETTHETRFQPDCFSCRTQRTTSVSPIVIGTKRLFWKYATPFPYRLIEGHVETPQTATGAGRNRVILLRAPHCSLSSTPMSAYTVFPIQLSGFTVPSALK